MQMNPYEVTSLSYQLKALSHPHRLSIVQGLLHGSSNVTEIQQQLGIPQPSVSAHLARLKTAGIVEGTRYGQEIQYSVIEGQAKKLVHSILEQV